MAVSDARVMAWVAAKEHLEVAQKVAVDHKKQLLDPLPEWYWALVAVSDVWARLAQTPDVVALAVGDYLADVERQNQRRRNRQDDFLNSFYGQDPGT